jgi:hypothetical protein
VDYSRALFNLNPILRRRLNAIAQIADMTEVEALRAIVETSNDNIESGSPPPSAVPRP